MSREIKFRAWDKERKTFCPIEYLVMNSQLGEVISVIGVDWQSGGISVDKIVLMQFTGLKDKNSRDIFEGDIVKTDYQFEPFEVVYLNGSFTARDKEGRYIGAIGIDYPEVRATCEVIGNIHENPELLK